MSERIAEFLTDEDAMAFMRMKGAEHYTVCGGINMPWAVRQHRRESIDCGPFEPRESVAVPYKDPDIEMEDYE